MHKEITVVLYAYRLSHASWVPGVDSEAVAGFVNKLHGELSPLGITVTCLRDTTHVLEVKSYADLLNTVRLRSARDHIGNLCLGHVIGQSANCDLCEDIRRGVSRVAFAPETIEPEGSHKVVCHNCGCGC